MERRDVQISSQNNHSPSPSSWSCSLLSRRLSLIMADSSDGNSFKPWPLPPPHMVGLSSIAPSSSSFAPSSSSLLSSSSSSSLSATPAPYTVAVVGAASVVARGNGGPVLYGLAPVAAEAGVSIWYDREGSFIRPSAAWARQWLLCAVNVLRQSKSPPNYRSTFACYQSTA